MRLVRQIAAAMQASLQFRKAGMFDPAHGAVAESMHALAGIDLRRVLDTTLDDLRVMLQFGHELHMPERAALIATLLEEEGRVRESSGADATPVYIRCLELLTELAPAELPEYAPAPAALLASIARCHEGAGRLADAEDALFRLLDVDPSAVDDGLAFYDRALLLDDAALERGGLPREEVEESRREILARKAG